jgi:hypothetical protein
MKQLSLVVAACVALAIGSCKKSSVNNTALVGKWCLINDSTFLAGTPIFQGGHANYIGVASDYFNFTSDGRLYIREGNNFDTATYNMLPGNEVKLVFFSINNTSFGSNGATRGTFNITNLTAHTATLTLPVIITPEGEEYEEINLSR